MMRVAVAAALLLAAVVAVSGCGITTHIEVAHRAVDYFGSSEYGNYKEYIQKHQDAFQAGNPYPDAMYNGMCQKGAYHQLAEDSHWVGFMNATATYIRRKYPKPWAESTEKLVAFLMGLVSHQVADVNWHALGVDEGFLSAMGGVNFHDSFSDAHSVGDPGGDIVANFELDLGYIGAIGEWYVPIDDLVQIYTEYYGHEAITGAIIAECTAFLFLGRLGEKIAVAKAFPDYAKKSPFLAETFHEYFVGGVDDMAAWTALVWHDTIQMVEKGVDTCKFNDNPVFLDCNATDRRAFDDAYGTKTIRKPTRLGARKQRDFHGTINDALGAPLTVDDVVVTRTAEGGAIFSAGPRMKALLESSVSAPALFSTGPSPKGVITTSTSYARLGWASASGDFNADGVLDLAMGAPGHFVSGRSQYGRVYVVNGGAGLARNRVIDNDNDLVIEGDEVNGRFGSALAVVDINGDGIDDLAVSAPSTGANALSYHGKVLVFLGRKGAGLSPTPAVTIVSQDTYNNFGWALSSGDLDGDGHADLVVGSPFAHAGGRQKGIVSVFCSSVLAPRLSGGASIALAPSDASWTRSGEHDYDWFGYSVSARAGVLVAGAPTVRICANADCSFSSSDKQSVGRVYGFKFSSPSAADALFTINGDTEYQKLGAAVSIGDPFATGDLYVAMASSTVDVSGNAVGIPVTWHMAGSVAVSRVGDLSGKTASLSQAPVKTTLEGDRNYAHFGWRTAFGRFSGGAGDDLMVGSPMRTEDMTGEITGAQEGGAYVFKAGSNFPTGKATSSCGKILPTRPCPATTGEGFIPGDEKSRFGSSIAALGNGVLAVGAERSGKGARLGGAVYVF